MNVEAIRNDGFDMIGVYLVFFIESTDDLQFHTFAVSNITITALFNITQTFQSNKIRLNNSSIIFLIILLMLKKIYTHVPHRFGITYPHTLYRSRQFYSTFKISASAVLKHSRFSEYMGLSEELRKLEKEQQQQQKKQIRSNTTAIIACFVTIGALFLLITQDAATRLKLKAYLIRSKISFVSKQQAKQQFYGVIARQLEQFMIKHPYDYNNILPILKDLAFNCKQLSSPYLQQSLGKLYAQIIDGNHKPKQQKLLLQGISAIMESSFIKNQQSSQALLLAMLKKGQIKQMYLAVICLLKKKRIILKEQLKKQIRQNLEKQYLLNSKYSSQGLDFPHIAFKKLQIQKWKSFIENALDLEKQ